MRQQEGPRLRLGEKVNRARRYPVHVPLRYRPLGESRWREGKTDNFGRTGVLFHTQELMKPGTPVEMTFQLPKLLAEEPAAWVVCEGRTTRLAGSLDPASKFSYAVRITKYAIVRGQGAPRRRRESSKKEATGRRP